MAKVFHFISGILMSSAAGILCAAPALAQNNGTPSRDQTVVYMTTIAERGLECDLLLPWESLTLKVQILQAEGARLSFKQKQEAAEKVAARKTDMACDDAGLTEYIDGAGPGIDREILPPYLVMYHTFGSLENAPALFTAAAPRLDYRQPIAKIEAKFADYEAKGYKPEGGGSWGDYRKSLAGIMTEALANMDSGDPQKSRKAKQAITYMPTSAVIVETWLADMAAISKAKEN